MGDLETRIQQCIERVRQRQKPIFPDAEQTSLKFGFLGWLYGTFAGGNGTVADRKLNAWYGRKYNNSGFLLNASYGYIENKEYDEGLICLRDALDLLHGKKAKLSIAMTAGRTLTTAALAIDRNLHPDKIETYLLAAAMYAPDLPERAWHWSTLAKELAREFNHPLKKEIYLFDALLATAQKRTDEKQTWKEAIDELRNEPIWERLGETRTIVRVLKNNKFFAQTLVFKERESRPAILTEVGAIKILEETVKDITVPQILYVSDDKHEGRYAYVMRYVEGETLYDKLLKGDKRAMPKVVTALAKIHAHYTPKAKELNLEERLQEKLADEHFNIPKQIAQTITTNYKPVFKAITNNACWVWNKDAHPENWIISKKIGVIDCEADHLVPATLDLANLLEYGEFFTHEEKKKYVQQYAHDYTKETRPLTITMSAYYNSVIHRMLSLASAWSSPERKKMQLQRKQAMHRAIEAIKYIAKEDNTYYSEHHEEYGRLQQAFEQLKAIL